MRTFSVTAKGSAERCRIVCRARALSGLKEAVGGRKAFVFTDENVLGLYGKAIRRALPEAFVYAMKAGENFKTPQTLFDLLGKMAEAKLNRASLLVALGGGVVGDVGGLAASLYMRGIACIQVPTTLLAQVDSSVGGKTAVDFCGVKNLVGAFHQPELVLVDPAFLGTLPPRELRCGLGEIIKHGALDGAIFDRLAAQEDLFDLKFLAEIVPENIAYKLSVVRRDPHETGLRKCLNLGHTTGHALELADGMLSHGEYVLLGIIYEACLARAHADCDGEYLEALEALCRRVLAVDPAAFDVEKAAEAALLDKKNTSAGTVVITAPARKGEYVLIELPYEEYGRELAQIRRELC